jgi:hypothetical protein
MGQSQKQGGVGRVARRRWLLGLAVLAVTAGPAAAQDVEIRSFTIQVGGKNAGKCVMTMSKHDDGSEMMAAQAYVTVKHLLGTFSYVYQGTEVWKDGRLLQMRSNTNDNGKRFELTVAGDPDGTRLRVNGVEKAVPHEVWTTSYWRLADPQLHNQPVPVLNVDTGKEFKGQLTYLGIQPLTVGGRPQDCYRFRLTGGASPVELWYDGVFRLVRQEFSIEGHRTVFHLTGLSRP